MNQAALTHLLYQLEACQAKNLLAACNTLPTAVKNWATKNFCKLELIGASSTLENLGRFDLIMVVGYLEALDKKVAMQHLAQFRNIHGSKIWVQINKSSALSFNDFIGLGFKRLTINNEGDALDEAYSYFGFDLASYNHKRSWNNSKYWANPENWNKFRW